MNRGAVFLGMGFEMVGLCMGGYYLGGFVDSYMGWETKSAGIIVLLLLIGWFCHLFILVKKFQSEDDDSASPGPKT